MENQTKPVLLYEMQLKENTRYSGNFSQPDRPIDLYGTNSNEVHQVKNAWAAVGVGSLPVISTSGSPTAGGTITGDGSHEWGSSTTVVATPNTGYVFDSWEEGGTTLSTDTSYTFTVTGDRSLVANFVVVGQEIFVNPASYYFGSFYVGNPSPYKTFTVTNNGLTELTIQSVSITGTNFQEFSYIDICTVDILSPSGDCIIDVRFLPLSPGAKNASLTIQSDDPVNPLINVSLSGTGMNNTPFANPGGPYTGIEGQSITLDGSGSNDADGTIDLYEWDIDDDGTYDYSSPVPTQGHTYTQDGTYTIKLRVTDNNGATGEATATANISDTDPTADFTGSPVAGEVPLTVDFTNNSGGYDTPLTYAWDCDNNGTVDSTAINAACTYNNAGIFTVKLTATDSDGSTDTLIRTDYITVTVEAGVYHYIQEAYDAAVDTNALQLQAGRFTEDLNLNQDKTITFKPGYDCDYLTNTGATLLTGDVVISNGVIIIESGKFSIGLSNASYDYTIDVSSEDEGEWEHFGQGTYSFSVVDGAWNDMIISPDNWMWSVTIYQPSTGINQMLGDHVYHPSSRTAALNAHINDDPIEVTVGPDGEDIWLYIQDADSNRTWNRGFVTVGVTDISDSCPAPTVRIF